VKAFMQTWCVRKIERIKQFAPIMMLLSVTFVDIIVKAAKGQTLVDGAEFSGSL